jgi:hypothetical protein
MENRVMRMGMRMSSLPLSLWTRTAMPASKAPVSVTIAKKPPKMSTKMQISIASMKPWTGAFTTSANVAPVMPSTPTPPMIAVMIARATSMISRIAKADILRFFLSFLGAVVSAAMIPSLNEPALKGNGGTGLALDYVLSSGDDGSRLPR